MSFSKKNVLIVIAYKLHRASNSRIVSHNDHFLNYLVTVYNFLSESVPVSSKNAFGLCPQREIRYLLEFPCIVSHKQHCHFYIACSRLSNSRDSMKIRKGMQK